MKKICVGLIILVSSCNLVAQIKIASSLSTGYINHSSRMGINTELGIDCEFIAPRVDVALNVRHSAMDANLESKANVLSASSFLSYVLINGEQHRLMFGPGLSYGKYERFAESVGLEEAYTAFWINPLKVRYDYYWGKRTKVGLDFTVYGEDDNDSLFLGLVLGYIL